MCFVFKVSKSGYYKWQELNQKVQQQTTEIEQLKKDNQEMKKLLKSLLKKK